jgi:hypothetical protein
MAGGSGGTWFSFEPGLLHAYHEIQLHSSFGGDAFRIMGVFNEQGELAPGEPATLHHRDGGAMLRWNATQLRGTAFVHVSSPADDVAYTMVAVLPPSYGWQRVAYQASHSFHVTPLDLQKNGAVLVELPFDFEFFGLTYQRMWVSSFGALLFEEPTQVGLPFSGVDNMHSAIVAAAGEFALDRAGVSVTMAQLTPTELEVVWNAPLFASDTFSTVSVVLLSNGSTTIKWDTLDLSAGGSLSHGLVSWLSFEGSGELANGATIRGALGDAQVVVGTASVMDNGHGPEALNTQAKFLQAGEPVTNLTMGMFVGGDPGDGLDFEGNFVYVRCLHSIHCMQCMSHKISQTWMCPLGCVRRLTWAALEG